MTFQNLRKNYPKFVYEKFLYQTSGRNLRIGFEFKIEPNIYFKPEVTIKNINKSRIAQIGDRVLKNLIFHLGLAEIPTYWKATCSPEIIVEAGPLNSEQIQWWKDLILNGMGQFFYENKIDFRKRGFIEIISQFPKTEATKSTSLPLENGILIPVGGGKDSIVTLEILKKHKKDIQCFSLNPTQATKRIIKISGSENPIFAERKIDKKLLELNRKGFLNGHTPFSAYLTFLSVLVSAIFGKKFIAVSNERSSNEGNIKYLGKEINHQWSKSFAFEQKFRYYSKKYLAKNIEYFSFLRPLYEIQIAKLFANYPQYFPVFLSCNEAFKTQSGSKLPIKTWCGKCSKCLFVFTALYPFLEKKQLLKIFNQNLFEQKSLLPVLEELIGEGKFKPFECVGTKKETTSAFYLSWKKESRVGDMPLLLYYFQHQIMTKHKNLEKTSKQILKSWNKIHHLSSNLDKLLRSFLF